MGSRRVVTAGATVLVAATACFGVWWLVADHTRTGCGSDAGPTAVVAVRSTDGKALWSRRLGHVDNLTVGKDMTVVEARTHDTTLDTATGEVISCVDHPEPSATEAQPVASSAPAPKASAETYELWNSNDEWDVYVASEPIEDQGHQRARIAVRSKDGEPIWDAVIPSFEMYMIGDRLVVIDQTGGDGVLDELPDTRITAYELATGERRWQVPLPGAAWQAIGVGDLVVVPGEAALYAIDDESGRVRWQTDLGNPGRGGRYTEESYVSDLVPDETGDIVLAAVTATEPYVD